MEEGKKQREKTSEGISASFVTGAIALIFLIIGYETALFVHKAAVTRIAANRDRPDTVYVVDSALARRLLAETPAAERRAVPGTSGRSGGVAVRRNAPHGESVREVREKAAPRRVESFRFDPNTASLEDLQRLGFSEKQAEAIDRYRQKGGRFRRPEDFGKSYVVADSVFERLKPYIDIPRIDINRADSSALLALPGIGPYFAGKVVAYREQLGGYSCPEQLLEIYRFDREKFDALSDLIRCSPPEPYPLWTLPEAELARHPYISRAEAHGIVLYRQHHAPEACSVEGLLAAGVLSAEHARLLGRCRIAPAR